MSYGHDAVIAMLTKCSDDSGTHWYRGRVWGDPETCPTQRMSGISIDDAVSGYLEYQLWAQRDYDQDDRDGDSTLDANYSVSDIDPRYVEQVKRELSEFNAAHPLAVRMYLAHRTSADFGGDFYLTREGHGAGFWDRGLGELGDYLTEQIKPYGHADDLWDDGTGVLVG